MASEQSETRTEYERLKHDIQDCPECSLYEAAGEISDELLCPEHREEVKNQPLSTRNFDEAYIEAMNTVESNAQQRQENEALAVLAILVSASLGGLVAVYLSRYFSGWPAQVAAGGFIWVLLSVLLTVVSITSLKGFGVIEDAN